MNKLIVLSFILVRSFGIVLALVRIISTHSWNNISVGDHCTAEHLLKSFIRVLNLPLHSLQCVSMDGPNVNLCFLNKLSGELSKRSPCIRAIVKSSGKLKIGTLILITCTGAIIGRDKTSGVFIPDFGVSKAHAEVSFNNEIWKYSIKDLGSQNGTFVNETRLSESKEESQPCVLNHGDNISIGSCKLTFHIHVGYETCDDCEPGQIMADLTFQENKSASVVKTKEEKEKDRRRTMRQLKKKYGLESMNYEEKHGVPNVSSGYEDKADIRRKTVGSDNPYEKIEASSIERTMDESNKGYQMLKKLGWKEGDSLGVAGSGISEPIPLRPWLSKAGFGSSEFQQSSMQNLPQDKNRKKWIKAQERFQLLS